MRFLTPKQQRILDFVHDYLQRKGYPPTLREIAAHFRLKGIRAVQKHLAALEAKGYLKRSPARSRALTVIRSQRPALTLPVLGRIRAGAPLLAVEETEERLAVDHALAGSAEEAAGMFVLRVSGDSMVEAGILDGDYVVVRPQATARDGEIVVALLGDEATVKRFYREREAVRLEPANARYRPIVVTAEGGEFRLVGRVVSVIRRV